MKAYIDQNQERWDRVSSRQGNPYTIPYSHEELQELVLLRSLKIKRALSELRIS